MIATWMVQALMVALLIAVAARAAEELFRLYGLPLRVVWASALAGAVVVPAWLLLGPATAAQVEVPVASPVVSVAELPASWSAGPAYEVGSAAPVAEAADPGWRAAIARRASAGAAALTHAAAARIGAATLDRALLGGWAALTLGLLLLFGVTMVRFAVLRRRWRAMRIADTPVYVAMRGGPAVVGVLRPAIVLPAWLLRERDSHQAMVVQHEREHLRAGDPQLIACATALVALLPWNVPLHWMLRRLRLAVELDCDRRVLARGARPADYGSMLIDVAGHAEGFPLATAALADGPSDLERRIVAMTPHTPRLRPLRAGLAAIAAAVLVAVACDVDLTDPALQNATIGEALTKAAEENPTLAPLALDARYEFDGDVVELDELRDVPIRDLARVEIRRPEPAAGSAPVVRITSNAAAQVELAAAAGGRTPPPPAPPPPPQGARPPNYVLRVEDGVIVERRVAAEAGRAQQGVSPDSARILVRSATGISVGNRPLVIVDGVIISGAVAGARIREDSVVALRGAAAEALYRSRQEAAAAGRLPFTVNRVAVDTLQELTAVRTQQRISTDSARVLVRSSAGISVANRPLFIVDGVVISGTAGNPLERLDADDIVQVEVIKGAAASALYGTRAANGVIFITTRRR
jgi:TonB-dependent SusC/RagA subfamily outer membrane receptor